MPTYRHCPSCDTLLDPRWEQCDFCGASITVTPEQFCGECGRWLGEGQEPGFCSTLCGQQHDQAEYADYIYDSR